MAKDEEMIVIEYRDPKELKPHPRNFRRHPEAQRAAVRASIDEFGFVAPAILNKRTGHLLDGHLRRDLQEESSERVPCVVVDWPEEKERRFLASFDRTTAMADEDGVALAQLISELDQPTGLPGFEEEELERLLQSIGSENDLSIGVGGGSPEEEGEEVEYGEELEDGLDLIFKAPFPWFGGKARVAKTVWRRFGDVESYIEPFFGSGVVLLNRPMPFEGNETVNDLDGLVCNAWRALRADPDNVKEFADWPVIENDLHARHSWLTGQKKTLQGKLEGDPDYFDVKIAGWWLWGMACWIGSQFCKGDGPWKVVEDEEGNRQLVHLGNDGQGVNRQRVHLCDEGVGVNRKRVHLGDEGRGVKRRLVHLGNDGQGVNRQRVHLSDAGRGVKRRLVHLGNDGQGVNRKRVHLGDEGRGVNRKRVHLGDAGRAGLGERGLLEWFRAISARLQRVRVCCGDWTRVCGGDSGDAISHMILRTPCGVFLDPPYSAEAGRADCYSVEDFKIAHAVREWAIRYGDDPRFRIALCGYEGEHDMPKSWRVVKWLAAGGMASIGEGAGKENRFRERVWFSPHCLDVSVTSPA